MHTHTRTHTAQSMLVIACSSRQQHSTQNADTILYTLTMQIARLLRILTFAGWRLIEKFRHATITRQGYRHDLW